MNELTVKRVRHKERPIMEEEESRNEAIACVPSPVRSRSKSAKKPDDPPRYSSVMDFCDDFSSEIMMEIESLKNDKGKKIHLIDGHLVKGEQNHFIYSFEPDDGCFLPAGTTIQIQIEDKKAQGEIIECEESNIYLSSTVDLGFKVPSIDITSNSWELLEDLNARLMSIKETPSKIVNDLILHGQEQLTEAPLNMGQKKAIELTQEQPITFIWGPPGTGKTTTLEKIARRFMKQGKRILMVSYSNVSVDGAVLKFDREDPMIAPGTVLRYGLPRQKKLLDNELLTSSGYVLSLLKGLRLERETLLEESKRLKPSSKRRLEITGRLNEIKIKMSDYEKVVIQEEAQFVATTISKAAKDAVIFSNKYDVVIMDEASMSLIPQVIFAASLAREHFICLGDFKQLPPIVQSEKATKLKQDIFNYVGIEEAVFNNRSHKWLCLLNTQFRMNPKIADIASRSMYQGKIVSSLEKSEQQIEVLTQKPFSGKPVSMIDLSGSLSVCIKTQDGSRINPLSAFISLGTALNAAENSKVGIITPYRSQAKLIRSMLKDLELSRGSSIACATVHQFQGSEKEVIIYDAADCFRMSFPGTLLTSMKQNLANRLFNVALTRSIGKFIGVANIDFFRCKHLSKELMFLHTMDYVDSEKSIIKIPDLFADKELSEKPGMLAFYEDGRSAEESYLSAIQNAQSEVYIDIPGNCGSSEFLDKFTESLQVLKDKGVDVCVRVEKKDNLSSELNQLAINYPYVAMPITIIDHSETWYGMPSSDAEFISEGKTVPTKHKPVVQFKGKKTAAILYSTLEMKSMKEELGHSPNEENQDGSTQAENNRFSDYVYKHMKCKDCGKPMKLLIDNKSGKFGLVCTSGECTYQTIVLTTDVNRYLGKDHKCPECNSSLSAKLGKYGVFVKCRGKVPHKYRLDKI